MQDNHQRPPVIAFRLVRWAAPALLREQILGDLEEEFHQLQQSGKQNPVLWYWDQALKTTAIYVMRERGDVMAFLVGVVLYLGAFVFASWLGGDLASLVNVPSIVIVFPIAVVFAIGASSWQSAKDSIALSFTDELDVEPQRVRAAQTFLSTLGNSAFHLGILFTFVGLVFLGEFITADNFELVGKAMGVALLTLIYGYGLKILTDVAIAKINLRYPLNHVTHSHVQA